MEWKLVVYLEPRQAPPEQPEQRNWLEEAYAIINGRTLLLAERGHLLALAGEMERLTRVKK